MKTLIGWIILKYLRFFARIQLAKFDPTIIGITGSAGKTSTRKAISLVLGNNKGKVKESARANSESGIPLNILGLNPINFSALDWLRMIILTPFMLLFNWKSFDFYIVEMGIDSPYPPKNMQYLLTILKPHVGVVLNAGLTHSGSFDHLIKDRNATRRKDKITKLIAKEKGKLVTTMTQTSNIAILNADQKIIKDLKRNTIARSITFGKSKRSTLQIMKLSQGEDHFNFNIKYDGKTYPLKLKGQSLEENFVYTLTAAVAVGAVLGIPPDQSITALEKGFKAPPGRWQVFQGIRNTSIIDSSYNASPLTMQESLTNFNKIAKRSHKIAVIGDMRELGLEEKQSHKDLANWIKSNSDQAFLFGVATKEFTLPVLKSAKFKASHYVRIKDLITDLKKSLKPNTWILVKGSQNTIFLERVVEALLKNKKEAGKLCRRGAYWDNVRELTS